MHVDVNQFRELFPVLRSQPHLAYLDNATAQLIPDPVIEAFNDPMKDGCSIARKGTHVHSMKATQIVENARSNVAQWHGTEPTNVIFQPTLPLANLLVAESFYWELPSLSNNENHLKTRQVLLLFSPDTHNSTFLPWVHAARRWNWRWHVLPPQFFDSKSGAEVLASILETADIKNNMPILILSDVSMVLGWSPPLSLFQKIIKKYDGRIVLDVSRGYQFYHPKVRWKDVDYLVANLGVALWMPHGLAVAIKKEEWPTFPPSFLGSGMVQRVTATHYTTETPPLGLEPDTLSIPHLNGLIAALQLLKQITPSKIRQHVKELQDITIKSFQESSRLNTSCYLISKKWKVECHPQGILSFQSNHIDPVDVSIFLEELHHVIVRAGDQCTQLLFSTIEHTPNKHGVIQASFSYHNTKEDVMKLIQGIEEATATFSPITRL